VETPRRQRGRLEHEVVAVLAEHGAAMTPGQVRDALAADLAYTTVMTTLARLCDKGVVTRERTGRAFAYQAVLDEDEITARRMQRMLDTRNDRAAVLSRFVGALSDDDERLLVDVLRRTAESVDGGDSIR
jgi:predicted transcriptional regulator